MTVCVCLSFLSEPTKDTRFGSKKKVTSHHKSLIKHDSFQRVFPGFGFAPLLKLIPIVNINSINNQCKNKTTAWKITGAWKLFRSLFYFQFSFFVVVVLAAAVFYVFGFFLFLLHTEIPHRSQVHEGRVNRVKPENFPFYTLSLSHRLSFVGNPFWHFPPNALALLHTLSSWLAPQSENSVFFSYLSHFTPPSATPFFVSSTNRNRRAAVWANNRHFSIVWI